MKVIYIAGPFRALTAWGIEQNVRAAEELALEAWRAGFAVICPHTNTRFYDGALPNDVFLRGDLEIVKRCDAVLLLPNWRDSAGAVAEVEVAKEKSIPVFKTLVGLVLATSELPNSPSIEQAVIKRIQP